MNPATDGPDLFTRAEEAAEALRRAFGERFPRIGLVLGSGLSEVIERFGDRKAEPYSRIPHFVAPAVAGHPGNVVVGAIDGAEAIILQGRAHHYEGHDLEAVTFPIRVLQRVGVETLILTASTGGIRPDLRPGNLVCLSDHLNLVGSNPLRGPDDHRLGARFPDMTEVYSKRLRSMAKEEARRLGAQLVSAVYACLPGPSYETPAEIRMLRALGADVVGMSVAPEAIVARHAGMDVLGLALVANAAAGVRPEAIRHEDVLEVGGKAAPMLGKLIRRLVLRIAGTASGSIALSGEVPTYRPD